MTEPRHDADDDCPPLTPEQRAELIRRGAEFDADPSIGIPWEMVLAEARARWRWRDDLDKGEEL